MNMLGLNLSLRIAFTRAYTLPYNTSILPVYNTLLCNTFATKTRYDPSSNRSLKLKLQLKQQKTNKKTNNSSDNSKSTFKRHSSNKPSIRHNKHIRTNSNPQASNSTNTTNDKITPALTFNELGLSDTIVNALHNVINTNDTLQPTTIQQLVITHILNSKSNNKNNNVIIGSHTGSGKTLAYLLPIIQQLKSYEAIHNIHNKLATPLIVVITPSRELTDQVYNVTKLLGHIIRYRSNIIQSTTTTKKLNNILSVPIDILVTTSGQLKDKLKQSKLNMSCLQYLVLDEADTLFDTNSGFYDDIKYIINTINKQTNDSNNKTSFISVSASMSQQSIKNIQTLIQNTQLISTNTLHKLPNTLHQQFINVGNVDKLALLNRILQDNIDGNTGKLISTIIFCNTMSSCRAVDYYLHEHHYNVSSYHGGIRSELRSEQYNKFITQKNDILVCTDLGSRGLDITHVKCIIMFDFPLNSIDYLHRAGRTGRANAAGTVISLVNKGDRVLAEAIKRAIQNDTSIHALDNNKNSYRNDTTNNDRKHNNTKHSNTTTTAKPTHSGKVLGRYSYLTSNMHKKTMIQKQAARRKARLEARKDRTLSKLRNKKTKNRKVSAYK